ncbi:MAG TPA: PBP1A family penicillin-binding protein [Blastocatellia bacterium]|nr:PBP1A family penicillin-binding protein [Blastocatellia bacterium]
MAYVTRSSRKKKKDSLPRRFFRFLFSPLVIAPVLLLTLVGAGVLIHYYYKYSELIDRGLRGEAFVRASGIYAAPKNIYAGSALSSGDLVAYLKRVGYLEKGSTKNEKRGQYSVRGGAVEVYPGSDAVIDGEKKWHSLRVSFSRDGVQSITDLDSRSQLDRAQLEPEMISSVITQNREKRKVIEYKDLPQNLIDAITTIEDRQFFEHPGVNWRSIVRALIRNYEEGTVREGGSTITQQLVKNFWLTQEKSYKRKLAEAYMSIILETRLSKEQIMAMYCNLAYQGQRGSFSINGFGESARAYFDKDISQLTLPEAALLAGIIRNPNYYSPLKHPDRAETRRNLVLDKMAEYGKVARAEADKAKQAPLGVKTGGGRFDITDAPYFVDYLTKQLESQFDATSLKSLRIYSSLDLGLQRAAYQAVSKHMGAIEKALSRRKGGTAGLQAALVAMNAKTGEVLAMIGGRDYASSQLNRATEARRQPGSVFKPFVYAEALSSAYDAGDVITPATMFMDEPKTFEYGFGQKYEPGNFGETYEHKPITLRDALVKSKNVVTVELAERVGLGRIARLAQKAGLPRPPEYPSMALGVGEATPLQMAAAYTMFANSGRRVSPVVINRVLNSSGATMLENKTETREVITPQVAYVMTSMMKDVLDRGTGARVRQMGFTRTAAGKTGSSRDGWFVGYTPNLVCAVWVGFDDNSDLGLTGGSSAAPIWAEFMMKALQLRPDLGGEFTDPGDISTVDIDPLTGTIAKADTPNVRHELFIKGTEPGGPQNENQEAEPPKTDEPARDSDSEPKPRPTPTPRSLIAETEPASAATVTLASARPKTGLVAIEVCEVSNLLPVSGLCRRTVMRGFTIGQEPKNFCQASLHKRRP